MKLVLFLIMIVNIWGVTTMAYPEESPNTKKFIIWEMYGSLHGKVQKSELIAIGTVLKTDILMEETEDILPEMKGRLCMLQIQEVFYNPEVSNETEGISKKKEKINITSKSVFILELGPFTTYSAIYIKNEKYLVFLKKDKVESGTMKKYNLPQGDYYKTVMGVAGAVRISQEGAVKYVSTVKKFCEIKGLKDSSERNRLWISLVTSKDTDSLLRKNAADELRKIGKKLIICPDGTYEVKD